MRIGLISDTHDNEPLTAVAARLFAREGIERVFHLGDVTQPETLEPLAPFALTVLRGNNDEENAWPTSWREEVDGLQLGATHGHLPAIMRALIDECDIVLHGHSHQRRAHVMGRALVVNPGALHRARVHTVATLEVPSRVVTFWQVTPDGATRLPS